MPEIQAFYGLRYNPSLVTGSEVISPPYDIVKSDDLHMLRHSDSATNSDRKYNASILENPSPTPAGYEGVLTNIKKWTEAEILIKESVPSLYLYEQIFKLPERGVDTDKNSKYRRRVLIAATRLSKPEDGVIRHHESTMAGPREDRLKLYTATKHAISPILASVEDTNSEFLNLLNKDYGSEIFVATDLSGVEHKLWKISEENQIANFRKVVNDLPATIADGHHRTMTALSYLDNAAANRKLPSYAAERFALMGLASDQDQSLLILPTHRILLEDSAPEDILDRLSGLYQVTESHSLEAAWETVRQNANGPVTFAALGLTAQGKNYSIHLLTARDSNQIRSAMPSQLGAAARDVDILVLTSTILRPIFDIDGTALAAGTKVGFEENIHTVEDAIKNKGAKVAFLANPATIDQVQAVAATGEVLPQKTTYYYPKLGTGLVFYPLTGRVN